VLDLAGEIPVAGTTYTFGDWTFRVQSVEKRRISELVIEHHPPLEIEPPARFSLCGLVVQRLGLAGCEGTRRGL
jgi:hypothetical protein